MHRIKLELSKHLWVTIILIIICVLIIYSLLYVYLSKMEGPSLLPHIDLEVYSRDNTSNKIVWVVKDINREKVKWEDIYGMLIYSNGTEVKNCTLLPQGYVMKGDLITVTASWDGDAQFVLMYWPGGFAIAETSIEHY